MDNKDKALEYCIEVYKQYTRAEINNFHGSVIRCWKVGKRASKIKPESEPTHTPKPNAHYVYCPSCGYEVFDCYVGYSRTTASGDLWLCPGCGEETSSVEIEDNQE